ncbi:MAG TPA: hypothetical protein VGM44_22030, partial [Polyangiaceae bacterium]
MKRNLYGSAAVLVLVGSIGACSSATGPSESSNVSSAREAVTTEDGLADGYAFFKQLFTQVGLDTTFRLGAGYSPALSTELVSANGLPASAKVILTIDPPTGRISRIQSTLDSIPLGQDFDL